MKQARRKNDDAIRILVIDDEVDMLTNYRRMLVRAGYECLAIDRPDKVETILDDYQPDAVLTDLVMPGASGIDILETVQRWDASVPVIIITAHGTIENAVEAIKKHAFDYLTKPFSMDELLRKIQAVVSRRLIKKEKITPEAKSAPGDVRQEKIIGVSRALKEVLDVARLVARTDVNVLIIGESGTGKEIFARLIHSLSRRQKEIFVPVDCASLPENLLESELFGYQKGAFTGATSDKMGLFRFAHRGTLFLDEIGELPFVLQAKLLRVLQERTFRPLGARRQVETNVRVIAATNCDLEQAVAEKTFRGDLYYRLNVVTLRLPPLVDRPEDIALLAQYFLDQFIHDNQLPARKIAPETMACLCQYHWPGNVREVQNVIEHATTLAPGPVIEIDDLPQAIRQNFHGGRGGRSQPTPDTAKATPAEPRTKDVAAPQGKEQVVGNFEREYLLGLLIDHKFNISLAAKAAGCHRRTLYRMALRHGLELKSLRAQYGRHGWRSQETVTK